MRRLLLLPVLLTTLGFWLGNAEGKDKASDKTTCGDYGTSVHFHATPSEAAKQALKEQKLVFVLHVSGHFEDSTLT